MQSMWMSNCVFAQNSHGSNALSKTDSIIYPFFSPIFILFTLLWDFLDLFPSLLPCPGLSLTPWRHEDEWLFLTLERWSWLIDSTSDRMHVTSLFPGCSSRATCSDEQELWMHCARCIFMYCAATFDTKNVFMPALSVFIYEPHVVLSLAIWIITGLFDVFLRETKLCLSVQSHWS